MVLYSYGTHRYPLFFLFIIFGSSFAALAVRANPMVMAYVVMAYIVMAYVVIVYIVMPSPSAPTIVMTYIVMVYIVIADATIPMRPRPPTMPQ